jgi:glycosyltransferase involved in cell wall biosynthesis
MRIAISARMLKKVPDDGISRFTFETVKRIVIEHNSVSFFLIFDREFDNSLLFSDNIEPVILRPSTRHPLIWYYWHEWQLPGLLKKTGADLFLSPDGIISLRSDVPSIPVIHDLNFIHRPSDLPVLTSIYYRYFFRKFAHKAVRIATVSEFSKNDISSCFNIDPSLIDVVHNGVSEYFTPAGNSETEKFRAALTGGEYFLLFVGNFSPRKNIPGLIKAYNLFRSGTAFKHKLVLTGGRLFLNSETDKLIKSSPYSRDIILTGAKDHKDLRLFYSSATALVFVPWFEGFGIPAAEAMRCGTPVILSDTTSLPEIGGQGALYADPGNIKEICSAMIKIIEDNDLRASLISRAQKEVEGLTWENSAKSLWKSVEKAYRSI